MDQRIQQAFVYATSYLQKQIEIWTERNRPDTVAHYQAELEIVQASFDEMIKESVKKSYQIS